MSDINIKRCFIDWYEIDFGMTMFVARTRDHGSPIGFVWGIGYWNDTGKGMRFEVRGSYILPWARRCGVRSLINEAILKQYPAITTPGASRDGAKFMRASGYRKDPVHGWLLLKKKHGNNLRKKQKCKSIPVR